MVTYYRDMWPRRSHILVPFTNLTGLPKKAKLNWTKQLDLEFKRVKTFIVQDVLMPFTNHNIPFDRQLLLLQFCFKNFYQTLSFQSPDTRFLPSCCFSIFFEIGVCFIYVHEGLIFNCRYPSTALRYTPYLH